MFEELLKDLGAIFHLKLHVDRRGACSIRINDHLTIQLQPDRNNEELWLFAKLGEVAPGKYRENVLKNALLANGKKGIIPAHFGYIANDTNLAAFNKYPFSILTAEKLSGILGAFIETASVWQEAITLGRAAP